VLSGFSDTVNQRWEEPISKTKPFSISKQVVWEAYRRVKANQGAAGVDGQSIKDFEADLKDNLYKIWNRMCSGSYFPPPVRTVGIAKKRWEAKKAGHPNGIGSCGADGGQDVSGARCRAELSPGLLWLHTRPISTGCSRCGSQKVLEV